MKGFKVHHNSRIMWNQNRAFQHRNDLRNLIGYLTLSQEYCKLIGWYWETIRPLWTLACPIQNIHNIHICTSAELWAQGLWLWMFSDMTLVITFWGPSWYTVSSLDLFFWNTFVLNFVIHVFILLSFAILSHILFIWTL